MSETLRVLVDLRDRVVQKSRIAFGNRLKAIQRGGDQASDESKYIVRKWSERFADLESDIDDDIYSLASELEIIEHAVEVKGVGLMLAAKVVSMIDIERASTVSALWRYAGYGTVPRCKECDAWIEEIEVGDDGDTAFRQECQVCGSIDFRYVAERRRKGHELHYNMRLKTAVHLVGQSFLKSNSPYRRIYDGAREKYANKRPDWTDGHQHYAAMRKMVKIWLSHLWDRWRRLEKLPVSDPYAQDQAGHDSYLAPEQFGWEELEVENA